MKTIRAIQFGPMPRPRVLAKIYRREPADVVIESSSDTLLKNIGKVIKKYIDLMNKYGFHRFSDGAYWSDDILTPIARGIDNISINGLVRFYDNNFFYRQPVVEGKIKSKTPSGRVVANLVSRILKSADIDLSKNIDKISITVPGPFTFYYRSLISTSYYSNPYSFAKDYMYNVLLREIEYMEKQNFRWIDIHEPELAKRGLDIEENKAINLLKDFISVLNKEINIFIIMYFDLNLKILEALSRHIEENNVYIHIDPISKPEALYNRKRKQLKVTNLSIGVFDSRNTKLEKYIDISRKLRSVLNRVTADNEIYLSHNAPLEFLPEVIAYRKLRIISRYTDKLNLRLKNRE